MAEKVERSKAHAAAALVAYRAAHTPAADGTPRNADADDVAAIGDLIADLLHLAEARGETATFDRYVSALDITGRALDHYSNESDPNNQEDEV